MAKHILTCRASIALHQDGAVIAAIRRFQTMLPTIPQAHGPMGGKPGNDLILVEFPDVH